MSKPDGPTLSGEVKKHLESLAKEQTTTARFWDAYYAIMDLYKALDKEANKAIRRYKPRKIEQDGSEFLVFAMPSVLFVLGSRDTFCILYRKADARFHVHEYANCKSIEEYEKKRTEMFLRMGKTQDLNELLD